MDRYQTLIPILGLRRADPINPRAPIGVGEVIALPDDLARSLVRAGSVLPSEDAATVDLDWADQPGWVRADDKESLIAAMEAIGADVTAMLPAPVTVEPVDLLAALSSGLSAGKIALSDLSQILTNEQALNDLAWRLNGQGLDPEAVRALLPPLPPVDTAPVDPAPVNLAPVDLASPAPKGVEQDVPATDGAPSEDVSAQTTDDTTAQPAVRGKAKRA